MHIQYDSPLSTRGDLVLVLFCSTSTFEGTTRLLKLPLKNMEFLLFYPFVTVQGPQSARLCALDRHMEHSCGLHDHNSPLKVILIGFTQNKNLILPPIP